MSDPLRVGVIGVNGIGNWHLYSLKQSERSAAGAVCDIDFGRAEQRGPRTACLPSATRARCTRAVRSTPSLSRRPPAPTDRSSRDALDAGMHVYCEKPIAPTSDEGYALARHAQEARRTLQVGFQFRFHTGYAAARQHVAELGELARINLTATNWFRAQAYFDKSPWRATWSMAGGGVLMNQAIHQIDALIATAGMPSSVQARVRRTRHRADVEDDAVAMLEWANGATGVLVASLTDPAGRERLEFFGARGALVLEDGYRVRATEHDDAQRISDECPDEFPEITTTWEPIEVARVDDGVDRLLDGSAPQLRGGRTGRCGARPSMPSRARAASSSRTRSTCRRSRTARSSCRSNAARTSPCTRRSWTAASPSDGPRGRSRTGFSVR